jgi:hypothetical protein
MSNFAGKVGEGFGKSLIAHIFLVLQLLPFLLVYTIVSAILSKAGAIPDLQTTVFTIIITFLYYILYELQYMQVGDIAKDVENKEDLEEMHSKLDTILALTDDLADE